MGAEYSSLDGDSSTNMINGMNNMSISTSLHGPNTHSNGHSNVHSNINPSNNKSNNSNTTIKPNKIKKFNHLYSKPSHIIDLIVNRDWQQLLIAIPKSTSSTTANTKATKEVFAPHKVRLYGVDRKVLPLHLACAMDPPPEVIEALLNVDKKKVTVKTPLKNYTKGGGIKIGSRVKRVVSFKRSSSVRNGDGLYHSNGFGGNHNGHHYGFGNYGSNVNGSFSHGNGSNSSNHSHCQKNGQGHNQSSSSQLLPKMGMKKDTTSKPPNYIVFHAATALESR